MLKRVPTAAKIVRDLRYLSMIMRERWLIDRLKMNDNSHLTKEWNFLTPAEQERYNVVIELVRSHIGSNDWGDVLEIGCAEGLFTMRLAEQCRTLTACDISPVACAQTRERLETRPDLRVEVCDLYVDALPGIHDVVFAMDVLEFIYGRDQVAAVGRKLASALRPDGTLVISICRLPKELRGAWWSSLFPAGDALIDFYDGRFGLRLLGKQIHSVPNQDALGYIEHIFAIFTKNNGGELVSPQPTR